MKKPTFSGEVQFAGYADSSRGGPRVTLRLADRDDLAKFIGAEGKRFMAVLVEIADDETPAEPGKPAPAKAAAPVKRERMGPLCEWAVYRCGEEPFQRWAFEQAQSMFGAAGITDIGKSAGSSDKAHDAVAKAVVLQLCQVQSRKDLDTDMAAGERFKALVMRPYAAWVKEQQAVPA